MFRKICLAGVLLAISTLQCTTAPPNQQTPFSTEVLIVGGGASGTAAAIQAARMGAKVLWITEHEWVGGMITAAGVSATDGNHRLPSGLWGEFRDSLYAHYGGPEAVATGWVSMTQFEPKVGNRIWQNMLKAEPTLTRWIGYTLVSVQKEGQRVVGATFEDPAGNKHAVQAQITIEATELGDVLALSGTHYFTGQDTPEDPHNNEIQDLTYAAILKDYGEGNDHLIPNPPAYDPAEFQCFCETVCETEGISPPDCQTVLNYGRLPNDKFMINWPNNGNDYFVNPLPLTATQRDSVYQVAKERTLAFVHYLQTEAGFPHYGLATDEFPTADHLPLIPYHREARRVEGVVQLKVEDLIDPYADAERPFYRSAIAVGDYPLDHHHDKNPNAAEEQYPPIPSFSVPYEALVPAKTDGLLVAEKSISVSHMVNGATRLQPCVILIGQAAGAAAAWCVDEQVQPRDLSVPLLQSSLLEANCWLMPFIDVGPDDPDFEAIQRAGVQGSLRGTGIPYKWANQTWLYPDSLASGADLVASLPMHIKPKWNLPALPIQLGEATEYLWAQLDDRDKPEEIDGWEGFGSSGWLSLEDDRQALLTRRKLAIWLNRIFPAR